MTENSYQSSMNCTNHPARSGVGVCIKCKKVVCSECSTKIDGINYCTGCLGKDLPQTGIGENKPESITAPKPNFSALGVTLISFGLLAAFIFLIGILISVLSQ